MAKYTLTRKEDGSRTLVMSVVGAGGQRTYMSTNSNDREQLRKDAESLARDAKALRDGKPVKDDSAG